MIRVVHVLHSFGTGGLEKGVATLVRHASPDIEHRLVCLTQSGDSVRLLPEGTPVIEMNKAPGNSVSFLWRLRAELRRHRPAVVHTRNWGGSDGIVAARLAGMRSIVHGEHGWDPGDPDGKNPRRLKWRRRFGNMARELTCVSKDIARWLGEDVGVKRPVTQVYNGVDVDAFCAGDGGDAIRRELGIAPGAFVAGIVGRLDPIKDHPRLFEAFEKATADDPDARLVVVGDGPERERLAALAGERVLMLGNRRDVPAILQALDLFVLCSWNEGISNTILEAMASSLPVLATRVGGNTELVLPDVTGVLVPAKDATALSAGIAAYHGSVDLRQTQGNAGRDRVCEKFSIAAMVDGYEQIWRRVAAH